MRGEPGRTILRQEIARIGRISTALDRSLRRLASMLSQLDGKASAPQRKRRLFPKTRAALKLQGRYMGYTRQLKPKQKAQVRKIREAKGVREAIEGGKTVSERLHDTRLLNPRLMNASFSFPKLRTELRQVGG